MTVKRDTLLLLACLVWGAAGFNILRIGLAAYPAFRTALNFCLSALVFAVFQRFVFGPLVKKHTARIRAYEDERHFFLKFFDKKAFAVMAVMMTGGIALRAGGLRPSLPLQLLHHINIPPDGRRLLQPRRGEMIRAAPRRGRPLFG